MSLLLVAAALAGPDPGLPPRTHGVGRARTEEVVARDGVTLRTHVVVPRGEGPFPTILTRYPYLIGPVLAQECRLLARRGSACVWQEVRGRLGSGGEWEPFVHEEADGQDTVAWIRAQPWSDGQVAWLGDSYLAGTGWTVGPDDPDGVVTMVSRARRVVAARLPRRERARDRAVVTPRGGAVGDAAARAEGPEATSV